MNHPAVNGFSLSFERTGGLSFCFPTVNASCLPTSPCEGQGSATKLVPGLFGSDGAVYESSVGGVGRNAILLPVGEYQRSYVEIGVSPSSPECQTRSDATAVLSLCSLHLSRIPNGFKHLTLFAPLACAVAVARIC